ncbi:phenylpropionate dioxygenase ferredoxin subunit [Nocardia farcinica]|uniref:Biphenyl dioxygenase ferredoxin subunit n=1 Tax=Nocardia farcinica TaxID=37329 RepID=A0A0H5NUQ7_NOCFR|nr:MULTISPECIES: non-heme iron oxygenase ferredoxin subunit [Nocardia]PEH76746.1 (2Fe-2S)-binding protein [Nocardia sp. FDAARGOS_372]SLH25635.1 Rieske (2Fe-2S) domain-containing protein [Mycobacteroides abscessus subsp. abscessus]AXK88899.1 non-heme iron oxygenase ferredoxin subunit [Nocardia farcinica]MBF6185666.1 non-heme iron oxygenase ferredoxin subunit [Nocardia farcinica]MBF6247345.1 non-heme iron oxygenase ferredoxin subunit [Nocardia elegans]
MTTTEQSENLVRVCAVDELAPGNVTRVDTNPPIAVYNIDGEFYATADWCSHDKSSLADEGFIENGQIECGWHFAKFCIKTGAVTAPPATEPLAKYAVRVVDGAVFVAVTG